MWLYFLVNEELTRTEAIRDVETTQNLTRTNFKHLEKLSNRSRYVARSCKEIRDRYGEHEGKQVYLQEVFLYATLTNKCASNAMGN